MKKTLIALAAVAVTGAAFAQSTVTLSGQLDVSYGKLIGETKGTMSEVHGSRVRFLGSEDLGGGLKANFGLEERLRVDNGEASGVRFNGYSTVGLSGGFGSVNFGRQYTANFTNANNKADPWGGDTAGALRAIGMQTTYVRTANSVRYDGAFGPVKVAASVGLKEGAATKNDTSFAVSYAAGALEVGLGQDNGADNGDVLNAFATYDLGVAKLAFGLGNKETGAGVETKGWLIGATIPAGPGAARVGYARAKNDTTGVTTNAKFAIGYQYPLSKRTRLEADFARDSKAAAEKSGYTVALTHTF
ncbi:porin [Hydrogenophaga sp.]|uniref:porin n=1 Tax=Hydrogenophaga sp. TaxID=1904254 RepID=UPI003F6C1F66